MPLSKALAELRSAGVDACAAPVFNDAISLGSKSINLNEIRLYKEGFIEVQDLASQVIGQVCAPKAGENWWDACSGAGGKSLQLSSLMQQDNAAKGVLGTITASDIRPAALNELEKRAKRAGFNIKVAPWRSDALPVAREAFDGVLVDAPCSCTGTWRRNPDMRWLDDSQAISDKPRCSSTYSAAPAMQSSQVALWFTPPAHWRTAKTARWSMPSWPSGPSLLWKRSATHSMVNRRSI